MKTKQIGIVHPGQMGVFIAAKLQDNNNKVFWASENRSQKTRRRAEQYHLHEVNSLIELCERCPIIVSVCPPAIAEEMALKIKNCSYKGIYVDANAINPKRSLKIGLMLESNSINYVDGGIIGNPAWDKGSTSLYLSGKYAELIADCFPNSRLEVHLLGPEIGKASAIKMCYASYTKGTTALLSGILALAEYHDVRDNLEFEWSRDGSQLTDNAHRRVTGVTAKAWRFVGEMKEIAATFENASLPDGFHKASEEVYRRIAHFKDNSQLPSLDEVLEAIQKK